MPLKRIEAVAPLVALLVIVSVPVMAPVLVGANCTLSVAVWVGFSVTGKVIPDRLNPVPLTLPLLMISGIVPVEVSVIVSVAVAFSSTLPKGRLVALRVSADIAAFNCRG